MKNFIFFLQLFTTLRPLMQEAIIAVKAVNIMKRVTKRQSPAVQLEMSLVRYFEDNATAHKAIAAIYEYLRLVAGDHECMKKEKPIEVITCYLHGAMFMSKREQRMLWRELARVILRYRNPDSQWDDVLMDTALQVGYSMQKDGD